jgi:hypothetical protein
LRAKLRKCQYLVLGAKPDTVFQFFNQSTFHQLAFAFKKQHDAEQ